MHTETVYGEDAGLVSYNSTLALQQIPEEAWPALLKACERIGGVDPGIDTVIAITKQPLSAFTPENYRRCGNYEESPGERYFEDAQVKKGQRPQNFVVTDTGDYRVTQVL